MDQQLMEYIPLARISDGENVRKRYDEQSLAGLSKSIAACGLQEPIHVMASGMAPTR